MGNDNDFLDRVFESSYFRTWEKTFDYDGDASRYEFFIFIFCTSIIFIFVFFTPIIALELQRMDVNLLKNIDISGMGLFIYFFIIPCFPVLFIAPFISLTVRRLNGVAYRKFLTLALVGGGLLTYYMLVSIYLHTGSINIFRIYHYNAMYNVYLCFLGLVLALFPLYFCLRTTGVK
ncbi:hypothetical protein [Budvicia aquatica]|uniref:DUF805 domain-containing protein n=1 Tax=Budvicia aquatica TaxID=82979 RepID=A0A2C6DD00_9GAMM|nr:hypothetical protein [Budvicia aquatica]PHI29066.1 hypothetical protein CRN84_06910 [Budvicia aquatica]